VASRAVAAAWAARVAVVAARARAAAAAVAVDVAVATRAVEARVGWAARRAEREAATAEKAAREAAEALEEGLGLWVAGCMRRAGCTCLPRGRPCHKRRFGSTK
tara:strand:+ start:1371 stop:1682 length:312 start_codon:yes stop_codon:yes gene_type:complete